MLLVLVQWAVVAISGNGDRRDSHKLWVVATSQMAAAAIFLLIAIYGVVLFRWTNRRLKH